MIPQESEHELAVGKEDGEQDFPAFSSLNGIHLNDGSVRISGHVFQIVFVGSPNMAMLVHPNGFLLFADAVADFPGQVDVAHGEKTCFDVVIDRLLVQHDLVGVACADMMNRLPLADQRRDDVVDAPQLFR